MSEHPNVEAVRRGYEAFNKGDMETLSELIAEDVVWHVPGRSSFAGDYQGREATYAYFGRLDERTEGTYQADLHIAVGDEEHVISIDHSSGSRGDEHYGGSELVVFRFRDGRVVEAWQAFMSPYDHDQFFS
ncbi:MAG: nuclear transport factor 2 family protein [Acidimicrobiia bacterium]